jgi:hypothetical protein
MEKVRASEAKIAKLQGELEYVVAEHRAAAAIQDRAMKSYEAATRDIARYEDVTQATVDTLRGQESRARNDAWVAAAKVRNQLNEELAARRAALERSEMDAELKQAYLNDLRAEAERQTPETSAGTGSTTSSIGRAIRMPFRVLGELVLGVGQSPEEIIEILRNGEENIGLLRSQLGAVDRAADAEHTESDRLRRVLDDCIHANQVSSARPTSMAGVPS